MSVACRLGSRIVAAFAGIALGCPLMRASGEDVLAAADFDQDATGALARPLGPPTVSEEVYDDGTTVDGVAEVEEWGTGKRFRLDDDGTVNELKAIRMPLSATVTSGVLHLSADLYAAQRATGGFLSLEEPDEHKWSLHVGFGSDGEFRVHSQPTTHSYTVGATYRVTATLTLGTSSTTVDYHVENLADPEDSFSVEGCTVNGEPRVSSLRFETAGASNGSFSIDNVLVTRP